MIRLSVCLPLFFLATNPCNAEVKMSSIFGESMVVQRDTPIHVWGWTEPSIEVRVSMAGHEGVAQSGSDGRFDIKLDPLPAGGPHEMVIRGDEAKTFKDVMVGEVWICSGQSNMEWPVAKSNDADLELLTAKYPNIRLISVPRVGTQQPQIDFEGSWKTCTPQTAKNFSAVGYFFGRQLHQTLEVPVGLIDNAWGGSAAEAWIKRKELENAGKYSELLGKWDEMAEGVEAATASWKEKVAEWEANPQGRKPQAPQQQLDGNHRPANIYNGVLHPTIGYTIRGVIWYQGESNAGRAYQYRDLFPLLIQSWRDEWGQGDFPFYWVQLADYLAELEAPRESSWAELREAQTMTMSKLPKTGEAVIIDLGEASDIHPRNKHDVGKRLARWALTHDYGIANPLSPEGLIPHHSPTFDSMTIDGRVATVKFEHVGAGLDTFDVNQPIGFAIAGEDRVFVHANAKITGMDTMEVWSDEVENPVAIRYAWADNPVCNVRGMNGLPLTPFRSDDWPGVTAEAVK